MHHFARLCIKVFIRRGIESLEEPGIPFSDVVRAELHGEASYFVIGGFCGFCDNKRGE
jgi:hypothetical protein